MSYYEEVSIEDMDFDEDKQIFYYPCTCGDRFQITVVSSSFFFFSFSLQNHFLQSQKKQQLVDGEVVGICPSCSLTILVKYDPVSLFSHSLSFIFNTLPLTFPLFQKTIYSKIFNQLILD